MDYFVLSQIQSCTVCYFGGMALKGNIRTISPCRNRFDFQILAYLVTIHLLYALDAYHIDSVNTCYD